MIFGLRCSGTACRPHPASLPVRVPTVESLPSASFSFASRLRLAVQLRLPSIGSDWLLSSNKILPMLGTPRRGSGDPPHQFYARVGKVLAFDPRECACHIT